MASSPNKTVPTEVSAAEFLAGISDPEKRADSAILLEMMERITGEPAVMWGTSIVGFGTYHYHYESGRTGDSPRLGFSPRKQNMVLYLMPGFAGFEAQRERLGKHSVGKSCLYIKRLSDVDLSTLEEMVMQSLIAMNRMYPKATS